MINLKNITKSYNNNIVLNNFNLNINKLDKIGIIGVSGCGKTTLLNILLDLIKYDSGNITKDNDIKYSVVFQDDSLIETMDAISNIALIHNDLKDITKDTIIESLKCVGLNVNINKPVSEYSGGMKRRVAIVRALLAEYDLIVFDEPLKGLDKDTKQLTLNYIKNQVKDKTVIYITHDIKELDELAVNKVIELR